MGDDLKHILQNIQKDVSSINQKLANHDKSLDAINAKLSDPEKGLDAINDKLDTLTVEMIEVKTLTQTTNELVKLNRQKTREEIREIKQYVNMPID